MFNYCYCNSGLKNVNCFVEGTNMPIRFQLQIYYKLCTLCELQFDNSITNFNYFKKVCRKLQTGKICIICNYASFIYVYHYIFAT